MPSYPQWCLESLITSCHYIERYQKGWQRQANLPSNNHWVQLLYLVFSCKKCCCSLQKPPTCLWDLSDANVYRFILWCVLGGMSYRTQFCKVHNLKLLKLKLWLILINIKLLSCRSQPLLSLLTNLILHMYLRWIVCSRACSIISEVFS